MSHYTADLHIHPRSTKSILQQNCIPEFIFWAKRKGIQLLGTGDFLYPDWLAVLENELETDGGGFFSPTGAGPVHFMLTAEVEALFQVDGKKYQIHLLLTAPGFEAARRVGVSLDHLTDLRPGGIPRLKLPASELVSRVLDVSGESLVIPLHIWSPWGSLFGSTFGFERLADCFGAMSPEVPAVETGLSGDPGFCWLKSELDTKQIVSFSDAHSPQQIGMEFTLFDGDFSYSGVCQAIRGTGSTSIAGTVEFFSEIGKYYFNGHRDCKVVKSPVETKVEGRRCPACRRELTIGTLQRSLELADREVENLEAVQENGWIHTRALRRPPYQKTIPLRDIIASAYGIRGKESITVDRTYEAALSCGATEYQILQELSEADLRSFVEPHVSEGILRVRESRFKVVPGFDGVCGQVELFEESEIADLTQLKLF